MRLTICLGAAAALCAYPGLAQTPPTAESAATEAKAEAPATPAPAPAVFQLNGTSWTFTDKEGRSIQESIDADGNYIANSGDKHIDHGKGVVKGDKVCFTSAMNKKGEECWTTKAVEVGQSMETTSDAGEKLTVTRVEYAPLSMPK